MQILNQSQTALNLPNFTQCLKKFVFPCKKGVKTAQVASQRELGRAYGEGRGKGLMWSARQKDGKSCRDIDGLRLRLHNGRVKEVERGAGVVRVASEVWRQGFSFGFGQGFYE